MVVLVILLKLPDLKPLKPLEESFCQVLENLLKFDEIIMLGIYNSVKCQCCDPEFHHVWNYKRRPWSKHFYTTYPILSAMDMIEETDLKAILDTVIKYKIVDHMETIRDPFSFTDNWINNVESLERPENEKKRDTIYKKCLTSVVNNPNVPPALKGDMAVILTQVSYHLRRNKFKANDQEYTYIVSFIYNVFNYQHKRPDSSYIV